MSRHCYIAVFGLLALWSGMARGEEPFCEQIAIFPAERKHNHASCVVANANGDLLAAWYSGTGERSADDVRILAARLPKGQKEWAPRFLLADTPGYPDCNPALFAPPDGTLWLFWPTILDHRWEGALLKFAMARNWPNESEPVRWDKEGALHVTPSNFAEDMETALSQARAAGQERSKASVDRILTRSKDLLYQRLGWMPRVHPTILPSGRWLLPLYTDTFSASIVAISDDRGATWSASKPMIGFGNIQPSIVRKNDGTLVAFMRDNGRHNQIRLSTSSDEGLSWSPVTDSSLPNPGAGIEAIRLANGHWILTYNDTKKGRHLLALSISDDEGATWSGCATSPQPNTESFHYPSLMQTPDGTIHATYTHGGQPGGSTIDYARFNEAWVQAGDPK